MRRFGFTILELLIVLSIIAFIAGVLMPALQAARSQARAVVCGSNIKQILNLLTIYEQRNGVFPHGFDDSSFITVQKENCVGDIMYGDKLGKWWFQSISDIPNAEAANASVFWCPSRCIKDAPPSKRNILCGNYGVNRSICKDACDLSGMIGSEYVGIPLSLTQVSHPPSVVLVVDSGYSLISWEGATNASFLHYERYETDREKSFYVPGIEANKQREEELLPGSTGDAIIGRHRQKTVNAGYADGHARQIKAEELFVREENGVYTNMQTWVPEQPLTTSGRMPR